MFQKTEYAAICNKCGAKAGYVIKVGTTNIKLCRKCSLQLKNEIVVDKEEQEEYTHYDWVVNSKEPL